MKKISLTLLLLALAATGLWRYVQPSKTDPLKLSFYQNKSVMIQAEPEEQVRRAEPVTLPLLDDPVIYNHHLQVGKGWKSR